MRLNNILKFKFGYKYSDSDLYGCDLSGVKCFGKEVDGFLLSKSCFDYSTMTKTHFIRSDLTGTTFTKAKLNDVTIKDCPATGISFTKTILKSVRIFNENLVNGRFVGTTFDNVTFVSTALRGSLFDGVNFGEGQLSPQSRYVIKSHKTYSRHHAPIHYGLRNHYEIVNTLPHRTELSSVKDFSDTTFSFCYLRDRDFTGCNFNNAIFKHCVLDHCRFDKTQNIDFLDCIIDGKRPKMDCKTDEGDTA